MEKIFLILIITFFSAGLFIDKNVEAQESLEINEIKKENNYSKISSIIEQWQSSTDPEAFAQENNLKYSNGKIWIYIYLNSDESVSDLSPEIEIISSVDNIVSAYASSQQITELSQLDFVNRIDSPVLPDLKQELPDSEINLNYMAIIILIILIVIGITTIFVIRRKRST